jgi:FkbM family methyltransferase
MNQDLIYDIGMHKGEDSAYYLAKGFRVVGVEANPDLAAHCRERFADDERHSIVEGAITDTPGGEVQFFRHPQSVFGTVSASRAEGTLHSGQSELIKVATIDLAERLDETGMPMYMKIDIEGADQYCLQALRHFQERPTFVSLEASHADWGAVQAELSLLSDLGYNRFSVVQQSTIPGTEIETRTVDGGLMHYRFEDDSSGPFGDDLSEWVSRTEAETRYRRIWQFQRAIRRPEEFLRRTQFGKGVRGQAIRLFGPLPGWFDTHATRA